MAPEVIPFDMSVTIIPENMRDKANNLEQMKKGVEWLMQKLQAVSAKEPSQEQGTLLLRIGSYQRTIGELEKAEKHIQAAREIFRKLGNHEFIIAADLRLATTYLYQGQHVLSENLYLECLKKIQSSSVDHKSQLLEYALTNYAKLFFERRQYQACVKKLVEALELKLISGDTQSITSHQKLIDIAKAAQDGPNPNLKTVG
ncbi:MAG: tetratricopeptide repeat protein [Bdellovibrio sp.]|nr:tetratricopeptide repeat protein [Bdellovibrio sp.]